MTPEEQVTIGHVRALIDASHQRLRGETTTALAEIGGKLDVLTTEQRAARELSSSEHRASSAKLDSLARTLDGLADRLDAVEDQDGEANARAGEAERWKKRFWALAVAAVPVGLFAAERVLA